MVLASVQALEHGIFRTMELIISPKEAEKFSPIHRLDA